MGLLAILRAPFTGVRVLAQAIDDLAALAENARNQPGAVERVTDRLDALLAEVAAVVVVAGQVVERAHALDAVAVELAAEARQIILGGRELRQTGDTLDGHAQEIIVGGQDLVAVGAGLDETLLIFREHMPRLLAALGTEWVGKVTKRLSRS